MGAAIIATITTTSTSTKTRTTTEEIAWQHRRIAAAHAIERDNLTAFMNAFADVHGWGHPDIAGMERDIQAADERRAFHLIRAKLLTCGRSHE